MTAPGRWIRRCFDARIRRKHRSLRAVRTHCFADLRRAATDDGAATRGRETASDRAQAVI